MFDVILKGGVVVDGTGNDRFRADVGITRGLIAAVGDLSGRRAERVVDVSGRFVVPGFVDALNHADGYLTLLLNPSCDSLIRQGITTIVGGNCGTSLAPLGAPTSSWAKRAWRRWVRGEVELPPSTLFEHFLSVQKWAETEGVNLDWSSVKEFRRALKRFSIVPHVESFVGLETLHRFVVSGRPRTLTEQERTLLQDRLQEALKEGALGLSLGLNFVHGISEDSELLLALARTTHEQGGVLAVHLRNEHEDLLHSVEEILDVGRETGVSLLFSHMKVSGRVDQENYQKALKRIEEEQEKGMDVNMTVYPYATSYSVLYQYLPDWVYRDGRQAMFTRFASRVERNRVVQELNQRADWFGLLVVARTARLQSSSVGKTILELARDRSVSVGEAFIQLLVANNGFVLCFDSSLSVDALHDFLLHPLSFVVSEGGSHTEEELASLSYLPHPRSFGAYPRLFREFVQEGKLTWEDAIQKCCSLPALKLGLRDRGFISRGLRADVVVIDPETIRDRATLQQPFQYSEGVERVYVDGEEVVAPDQT